MTDGNEFAAILGGASNLICAATKYSSILGGQNNTAKHNWATVAGCGVTSNQDCAFHANILVSTNLPNYLFIAGPGTIGYLSGLAGIPTGYCVLVSC